MYPSVCLRLFLLAISLLPAFAWSQSDFAEALETHRDQYKIKLLQGGAGAPLTPARLRGVTFFPANPDYRVTGTFSRTEGAQPFQMATTTGKPAEYVEYGTFHFTLDGEDHQLTIYRRLAHIRSPLHRDLLFLPFLDETNGESTYAGGRYLDVRIGEIEDGRLTVDFNRAYNPFCVYNEEFSCPIPPRQNRINAPIPAGEKAFTEP